MGNQHQYFIASPVVSYLRLRHTNTSLVRSELYAAMNDITGDFSALSLQRFVC